MLKLKYTINELNTLFPVNTEVKDASINHYWNDAILEAIMNNNYRTINELLKLDNPPPTILEIVGELGIYNKNISKIINKIDDINNIYTNRGVYWLLAGENFEFIKELIIFGFKNDLLITDARRIAIINNNIEFLKFLHKYKL